MTDNSTPPPAWSNEQEIHSFQKHLFKSRRILTLCGAGLSATSGLPTFRGKDGLWKKHRPEELATREAFEADPVLVWQFYAYRRAMALRARPNDAHRALAQLAGKKEGFVCLTQNVDGLSTRANHPADRLHLLHGSLFDIKCISLRCNYIQKDNLDEVICPALAVDLGAELPPTSSSIESQSNAKQKRKQRRREKGKTRGEEHHDLADPPVTAEPFSTPISIDQLPRCPKCKSLLRPGVVWFGEELPRDTISTIDAWIEQEQKIDLMLVLGTTAQVYPAAGYIYRARQKGARVAVVNVDSHHLGGTGELKTGDWMFEGDCAEVLPVLFEGVLEN